MTATPARGRGPWVATLVAGLLLASSAAPSGDDRCPPGRLLRGAAPPAGLGVECVRPDGVRDGPFRNFYPSGAVADAGTMLEGELRGVWIAWYEDGTMRTWHDARAGGDDYTVWWNAKGQRIREGGQRAGEPDGVWLTWWPNGWPRSVMVLHHGAADGPARFYHENGTLRSEGALRAGRKIGVWRRYASDGTLIREVDYEGGARQDLEPVPAPGD